MKKAPGAPHRLHAAPRPGQRSRRRHRWVLVLAGGDGRRLAPVTRSLYGYARPKQFCAFDGSGSLLEQTLRRAAQVVDTDRIVVAISRRHWQEALDCMIEWPEAAIVDQPANRDTLPGILWPLMQIMAEDPDATVTVMPSDHHISPLEHGQDHFARALDDAAGLVDRRDFDSDVLLLGSRPDRFEEGVGWIVPERAAGSAPPRVAAFHEKPGNEHAQPLLSAGALINTFVMTARAAVLSDLMRRLVPRWWLGLSASVGSHRRLQQVYDELGPVSFSDRILAPAVDRLRVVTLTGTRWSDIGTPERLRSALSVSAAGRRSS